MDEKQQDIGPTCRTCPFADEFEDPKGFCRAEPPVIVAKERVDFDGTHGVDYEAEWPIINADFDWCGKHPGRRVPLVIRMER